MRPTGRRALARPIRLSLGLPQLMWGVARRMAIINITLTLALLNSTRSLWVLFIGGGLHAGAYWLTKKDPYWIEKFVRYWKTPRYYDV